MNFKTLKSEMIARLTDMSSDKLNDLPVGEDSWKFELEEIIEKEGFDACFTGTMTFYDIRRYGDGWNEPESVGCKIEIDGHIEFGQDGEILETEFINFNI